MRLLSIKKILFIILLAILVLAVFVPIYWMISSSFKVDEEIFNDPPTIIPRSFTLEHYRDLFGQFNFGRHLVNTVIISIGATLISMVLGLPAAYGFSRFKFPGSNIFLLSMLLVRLFTPAALIIPFYNLLSWMHLIDSLFAIMICNTVINLPFVLWVMKVFFDDFPKELDDAAKVDGSSFFRTFTRIVIPCSLPAILTVVLFSFCLAWSDFLFGLAFTQSIRSEPATVAIASMITGMKIYWGPMMAGGTTLAIPLILLTLILQKYFIKGLAMGAVKG